MGDTIYALATAPGRAGVAIVRVSGPLAAHAVRVLTGRVVPKPRSAVLRHLHDFDNETIDEGLVLWFRAPASFTGEDVAEFHLHGGQAVAGRVLELLGRIEGFRVAGRGEFTRRAVENGKLDLTRAEGLADLVDAETLAQQAQAIRQYLGGLYELAMDWRQRLIEALAWAEAAIDFAEDEVPAQAVLDSRRKIEKLLLEMQGLMSDRRGGEILREGIHLTVIGPPNAGKSSLVNALARRDVAIVSASPGTTRDVLEARLDLDGLPVIVADTAGLRTTEEPVEAEGVRRARARAQRGDLTLLLLDGSAADPMADIGEPTPSDLVVWNKSDLSWPVAREGLCLSLRTGKGLDSVVQAIGTAARERVGGTREGAVLTRARHREAVGAATEALERSLLSSTPELMAEDLRLALRALGRLTGQVDVEDLLDVIFRDFCIGK